MDVVVHPDPVTFQLISDGEWDEVEQYIGKKSMHSQLLMLFL